MSQNSEEFDRLQKLLALKRREAPPPDFFNEFSHRVLARLEDTAAARQSWWRRLWEDFEAKPVLACACGLAVFTVLLWGLPYAYRSGPGSEAVRPLLHESFGASAPAGRLRAEGSALAGDASGGRDESPSTAPVLPHGATNLMWSGIGLRVQPASFRLNPSGD